MKCLFNFRMFFAFVFMLFVSNHLVAQSNVNGHVTAQDGQPLIGVTITEKGTKNAVVSKDAGRFSITLSTENPILLLSYTGYVEKEVAVGNQNNITVSLEISRTQLSDIVVIGYGTQRKKDLTGSLSSLSAADIDKTPVSSIDKAMQGQLAGVQISNTSGAPGGNTNVLIRGISSITGSTNPLYVIDGYPVTNTGNGNVLNTINTNDIQSVDVLKDASATAIYGSRGSNGVVIINTKRGKVGKAKIGFNAYTGIQEVAKEIKMMNAKQYAQFVIDGRNAGYLDNVPNRNIDDPNSMRPGSYMIPTRFQNASFLDSIGNGTNWQNAIFRKAKVNSYQLSVTGGNEGLLYSISGGYLDQDGIVIQSNFKRYSFKLDLDAKINKNFSVGISFLPTMVQQKSPPVSGHYTGLGMIQSALAYDPTIPIYNADGSYGTSVGEPNGQAPVANPVKIANEYVNKQDQFRLLANSYAELTILPSLKLRTTLGTDLNYYKTRIFQPSTLSSTSANSLATASAINNESTNWLSETTISYKSLFGESNQVDFISGFTAQQDYFDNISANAVNFADNLIQNINGGVLNSGGEEISRQTMLSWFARANYSYASKYLLTATIRTDGSSRFGANKRWGTFPSASLGWRVSREKFMENLKFISDLKIRAGYGVTGNNAISNYQSLSLLSNSNYVIGNALAAGTVPATLANNNLSWESQAQLDIGIDLSLLNNRINITADYYDKRNKDMLFIIQTPAVTGFTNAVVNLGEVQNKGYEFSLNTSNLVGKFNWNSNFNITFNQNKVIAMNTSDAIIYGSTGGRGNTNATMVGQPIGVFYGKIALGIFNSDAEAAADKAQPLAKAGDIRFKDVNGDGKIDDNDRGIIGSPHPKYFFGFNNSFAYKGFTLDINTNGQVGQKIYSALFAINNSGVQNNAAFIDEARWRSSESPGSGSYGQFGRAIRGSKNINTQYSSLYIFDGSYWRINQINLGFNLPNSIIDKIKIQSAKVYVGVNNVYTFTKYFGYDPEVGNAGNVQTTYGVDFGTYPTARTFTLGINLSL